MTTASPKYEPHVYGPVKGVVIGENNTVTFVFQSGGQRTVPFLAPTRPPYKLVERDNLLRDLKQRLLAGGSMALSALNGLPGVGKTALAVELAHDREVLEHFEDGVLWVGLGRQPNVPALLSAWGAALGILSDEITRLTRIEDRAKIIHDAIGMRRMLLVADDAWQVETALIFKLGGSNCAHLVTTRFSEIALRFAGDGAMTVSELNEFEGLTLLTELVPEVVKAESHDAQELVRAVGGLPLALVLMGNYLRVQAYSKQPRRLRTSLEKVQRAEERLQLAEPQAPAEHHPSMPTGAWVSLETVIGISDEALDEASRRTLRTLSVFPPKPNTFPEEAGLAVSAMPAEKLDTLTDYGLLEGSGPGRYTMHQTIADYARLKLTDMTAYERMAKFLANYAEAHETNYDVLERETTNILAALEAAFERDMQEILVRGANAFYSFLGTRGLYELAEVHLVRALRAAKSLDDSLCSARVLLNLGRMERNRGNYEQAEEYFQEGLTLARAVGDHDIASGLLYGLGAVARSHGDYERAEEYWLESLVLGREIRHEERMSAALRGLGMVAFYRDDHDQAEEYWLEGLALARKIENCERISAILHSLGGMTTYRGDFKRAEEYFQEGLDLARKIGYHQRLSALLGNLGAIAVYRGDFKRAEEYFQEGLDLARKIEHRDRMVILLADLGWMSLKRQDYRKAERYLQEGLTLAREIGHREYTAFLLANFGALARSQRDFLQAEKYLQEGLTLAREIGHSIYVSTNLNELGFNYLMQYNLGSADSAFHEAKEIARSVNFQEQVAFALYGLAQVATAQGNFDEAYYRGTESLNIFEAMGHYMAAEVKEWLARLPARDLKPEQDNIRTKNAHHNAPEADLDNM